MTSFFQNIIIRLFWTLRRTRSQHFFYMFDNLKLEFILCWTKCTTTGCLCQQFYRLYMSTVLQVVYVNSTTGCICQQYYRMSMSTVLHVVYVNSTTGCRRLTSQIKKFAIRLKHVSTISARTSFSTIYNMEIEKHLLVGIFKKKCTADLKI